MLKRTQVNFLTLLIAAISTISTLCSASPNPSYKTVSDVKPTQQSEQKQIFDRSKRVAKALPYLTEGIDLYRAGKYNEAIKVFSKAIEIEPMQSQAYSNRGLCYYILGNNQGTFEDFEQAILFRWSQFPELSNKSLLTDANLDKSKKHTTTLKEQIAAHIYASALNNEVYLNGKPNVKREQALKSAFALDPKCALALVYQARETRFDNPKLAVEDCTHAIERDPHFAQAYVFRGQANLELRNIKQAIEDFKKAKELGPRYSAGSYQLSQLYLAQGHLDKAMEEFTYMIKRFPDDWSALLERGQVHLIGGNYPKAIDDLTNSFAIAHTDAALLLRGVAYEKLGQYQKAIDDFDKVSHTRVSLSFPPITLIFCDDLYWGNNT